VAEQTATNGIDLSVALGGNKPYSNGDMTGAKLPGAPLYGTWIFTFDAGEIRSWGRISWNADLRVSGSITVKVNRGAALTPQQVAVANGTPFLPARALVAHGGVGFLEDARIAEGAGKLASHRVHAHLVVRLCR